MADYGMRIAKDGQNVLDTSLAGLTFDSQYYSLMLIEKKVIQFTAAQGSTDPFGSEVYNHSYGYSPFTLGYITYTTDFEVNDILPHVYTSPFDGESFDMYANIVVTDTSITIDWQASRYISGVPSALPVDVDFTVVLHIYGFPLGYKT